MGNEHTGEIQGGVTGRVNEFSLINIEQKFQHFLNAMFRRRGTYLVDQPPFRFENDHWIIRINRYACVGYATQFLGYWYNFNELFRTGPWSLCRPGIQHVFDQSIDDEEHPGTRELIAPDPEPLLTRIWLNHQHIISFAGTVAQFINDGYLKLVRANYSSRNPHASVFRFKWNPDVFSNFNVLGIASHHVIMHVKRGSGGGNSPPNDGNRPHQIWRLAADGPPDGTPLVYREEELSITLCRGCPPFLHHRHSPPPRGNEEKISCNCS